MYKQALKALREKTGETQRQIAKRLGIPYSTWFKWEQDVTAPYVRVYRDVLHRELKAHGILIPE